MWMAHYNVWTLQKCSHRPFAACQPANPSAFMCAMETKRQILKKNTHTISMNFKSFSITQLLSNHIIRIEEISVIILSWNTKGEFKM